MEPLILAKDLKSHVHINAIGSQTKDMMEIDPQLLAKSVVFADQLEAVLVESGEIIQAVEKKIINKDNIMELGHWLLDKKTDYKNKITVFKSVELAIQDLRVASVVYKNALEKNLGTDFSLN